MALKPRPLPLPVNDSSYIQVINEQFNTSTCMLDKAKKMATFKSVIFMFWPNSKWTVNEVTKYEMYIDTVNTVTETVLTTN